MTRNTLSVLLVGCALAGVTGCTGGSSQSLNVQLGADPFVPIPKSPSAVAAKGVAVASYGLTGSNSPDTSQAGVGNDFYIAINQSELGNQWFLSGYMQQLFPGEVSAGAARSVGVKVVTFSVQNGRLYVIDDENRQETSDTFDPTLLVEAYPVVTDYAPFNSLPGSNNYILFDPSAGLNQFAFLSDVFSQGTSPTPFQVDLSYMQNFRKISDGVTYEQVFMGYTDTGSPDSTGVEVSSLRESGTLGIALRRYEESPQYVQAQQPPSGTVYYFLSDPALVPDSPGYISQVPIKWPIYKGMPPIQWVISPDSLSTAPFAYFDNNGNPITIDPTQYDVFGALKTGIENWNLVFQQLTGDPTFTVIQARLGTAADSFSDDDENYLIYDLSSSFGAAFANWRDNPNTGEIRGASVYFSNLWLGEGVRTFDWPQSEVAGGGAGAGASGAAGPGLKTQPIPQVPGMIWLPMQRQPDCLMWPEIYSPNPGNPIPPPSPNIVNNTTLTPKQQVEALITHIAFHEVGHTLGLRHNFKGSMVGSPTPAPGAFQSSSVMEYSEYHDSITVTTAGTYDTAAINWLYNPSGGAQPAEPTDLFCNDDSVQDDPDCDPYDRYAQPMTQYFASDPTTGYTPNLTAFLQGTQGYFYIEPVDGILKYTRTPLSPPLNTTASRVAAWNVAFGMLRAPISAATLAMYPPSGSYPGYAAQVDGFTNYLLTRAFMTPSSTFSVFPVYGPTGAPQVGDTELLTQMVSDLYGALVNADNVRSYATRRLCVDILKQMQVNAAYQALVNAQAAITTNGLSGDALLDTKDLLARINAAVTPYFN